MTSKDWYRAAAERENGQEVGAGTTGPVFTLADLAEAFKAGERFGEDNQSSYEWGCGPSSREDIELSNAIYDCLVAKNEHLRADAHEKSLELAKRALAEWRAR